MTLYKKLRFPGGSVESGDRVSIPGNLSSGGWCRRDSSEMIAGFNYRAGTVDGY